MSLRERHPRPGLPNSHFFLTISRGDSIRTLMLRPAAIWALTALAPLSLAWGAAAAAYLAFHGDLMGALVERQAAMESAYEDRLAEARAQLDEVTSRQLLDQNSFEGKMHELLSRQARLEQRGAIVAALAAEAEGRPSPPSARSGAARSAPDALGAIQSLGPLGPGASDGEGSARAYAPAAPLAGFPAAAPVAGKPRRSDETRENLSVLTQDQDAPALSGLSAVAENSDLDAAARLDLIDRSLARMEGRQMTALAAIDRKAIRASAHAAAIVAETGLDPMRLAAPNDAGAVGGPYIPIEADREAPAFDRAAARAAHDVGTADRLKALMPFIPLRKPLDGDASLSSPFGYRIDPFLGRPSLHPGVDLIEAYGAQIRCAGAGRVVHAGPMGGYGEMVEIDHGNGLTTRYAHMSEILVVEGQDVPQGAIIGRIGSSGRSTGPHLHYEVRVDGEPVDPERFLRAGARLAAAE